MKVVIDRDGGHIFVDKIVGYRKGTTRKLDENSEPFSIEVVQAVTVLDREHVFEMTLEEFEIAIGIRKDPAFVERVEKMRAALKKAGTGYELDYD